MTTKKEKKSYYSIKYRAGSLDSIMKQKLTRLSIALLGFYRIICTSNLFMDDVRVMQYGIVNYWRNLKLHSRKS